MKKIATGGNQDIVAIDRSQNIHVLTEAKNWKKFPGKAIDVDVGDDGEFWAVTPEKRLVRWDGGEWDRTSGKASKVFVGKYFGGLAV